MTGGDQRLRKNIVERMAGLLLMQFDKLHLDRLLIIRALDGEMRS
jgi:hypothetical protein